MNKNLKKVISAIAALALSVTSFVAMASYPDVPDTDKHASAINELSALGIIEGFEDGTFHPDELVTRAQMAKMVVSALNIANAESNKVQVFNDVPADNWAAGWVATASTQGFINGTGNGNFDPNLNVTYEQTVKMLVSACGYDTWAKEAGGYPTGYLKYGNDIGVMNGVTGVSYDTALTRAQCAQMIANALEAPILSENGYTTNWKGESVPNLIKQDGGTEERSPFKSLLIDKWDMYVVNGQVTDNGKDSDSTDKVTYQIQKTKNYLGEAYNTSSIYQSKNDTTTDKAYRNVPALYGTTGADNYLNQYTKAIIQADDYSDPEIVYIEGSAKSDTLTFNSNLYKENSYKTGTKYNTVDVRKSATTNTTTTYKLDTAWKLVVNGIEVTADQANIKTYIEENKGVTVTMTDNPNGGTSTDGYYDVVAVDFKVTAVVDSISEKSDKVTVSFKDQSIARASKMEIRKDDDSYKYTFTKDGSAINVTDLKENDVLSISYNPTDFSGSSFYDVEVCNKTVEGQVTRAGQDEFDQDTYTIGGTEYSIANGMNISVKTGNEYTAYLTADNKIAYVDKLAASVNYGIIDRVYKSSSGEYTIRMICKDGVRRSYEMADDPGSTKADPDKIAKTIFDSIDADDNWETQKTKAPLEKRIVDYTITSGNQIKLKSATDNITVDAFLTDAKAESFVASTNRLGSYILDDSTVVLDIGTWWTEGGTKSVSLSSVNSFVDDVDYQGVVARDSSTSLSESVPFVAITEGLGGWSVDTPVAVLKKSPSTSTHDSVERTELDVVENGEEKTLICEDLSSDFANLTEGTAFIYDTNSDGYVDTVYPILNSTLKDLNKIDKYDIMRAILTDNASVAADSMANTKAINDDAEFQAAVSKMTRGGDTVEFILAPVLDKSANSITIGGITYDNTTGDKDGLTKGKNAYFTDAAGKNYSYDSTYAVYTFSGEESKNYKVETGNGGSVVKSSYPSKGNDSNTSYIDKAGKYVTLGLEGESESINSVSFALLKVYDKRVQVAYSITLDEDHDSKASFDER